MTDFTVLRDKKRKHKCEPPEIHLGEGSIIECNTCGRRWKLTGFVDSGIHKSPRWRRYWLWRKL